MRPFGSQKTGLSLSRRPRRPGSSLQTASVATLVIEARKGDPGAWEELVARFGGMIAATGRRYRLGAPDVAELQQTTWLRLVENLHRIEQPDRVGGWLATTARRESLQLLKRAAKYHGGADEMLANMPDRHLPRARCPAHCQRARRRAARSSLGAAKAPLPRAALPTHDRRPPRVQGPLGATADARR